MSLQEEIYWRYWIGQAIDFYNVVATIAIVWWTDSMLGFATLLLSPRAWK